MKKTTFLLLLIVFVNIAIAQKAQIMFVAAKQGLTVREKPDTTAKIYGKIAYGQKVNIISWTYEDNVNIKYISTEGFSSYWQKVKFNNKTGYVISAYLFPVAPPKKGVTTVLAYFNQLSAIAGKSYVKNSGDPFIYDHGGEEFTKKLYKNGMETHQYDAYEYGTELYLLPGFSVQQAFLLMRLLQEYPELIAQNDLFPTENSPTEINNNNKKTIIVEKEDYSDPIRIKKVTYQPGEQGFIEFSIYMLDGQAVIFKSWGA